MLNKPGVTGTGTCTRHDIRITGTRKFKIALTFFGAGAKLFPLNARAVRSLSSWGDDGVRKLLGSCCHIDKE